MATVFSVLHGVELACVVLLLGWGLHRTVFLVRFLKLESSDGSGEGPPAARPELSEADLPRVCVQLPIYNERHVVERLIRSVGALDWPAERLEIQVLDDSDDETVALAAAEVERLRATGIDARHLRRGTRTGYKAGALAYGLAHTGAERIAIFDADFVVPPQFLRDTVPALEASDVGMVQARWAHLNRDESLLTRAQAALLDAHFGIEHRVRAAHGLWFNFNGTAGVWRRRAIEEAGGWTQDTLTEDLDLSYRAQLAGWRFVYLDDVAAPAELPADLDGFRQQQHRWAKGSAQTLRKLGGRIARADGSVERRAEAFAHLGSNIGYPAILLLVLLLPISLADSAAVDRPWHLALFAGTVGLTALFYERCLAAGGRPLGRRLVEAPLAIALGIGISLSQTRAVLEGLFGRGGGEFARTPKKGAAGSPAGYAARRLVPGGFELLVAAWLMWALWQTQAQGRGASVPLVLLLAASFTWIGRLAVRRPRPLAS